MSTGGCCGLAWQQDDDADSRRDRRYALEKPQSAERFDSAIFAGVGARPSPLLLVLLTAAAPPRREGKENVTQGKRKSVFEKRDPRHASPSFWGKIIKSPNSIILMYVPKY